MHIKDTLIGGRDFNLPLISILGILLLGGLYLFPNGIEPRIQRELNLISVMLLTAGLFIGLRISLSIGSLLIYLSLLCFIFPLGSPDAFIYLLYAAFFILVVETKEKWGEKKDCIYNTICIIALVNVVWEISQYFQFFVLLIPKPGEYFITGLMSNTSDVSTLLAICLPAFFRKKWCLCIPFIFLGLWMAGSINGLMTSLIVWLIFETRSKKQFFIFLVMCISILSLFLIFRNNFNLEYHKKARLAVYGDVAKISAGTLFGYGLGQFKYMFPLASSYKYLTPEDRKKLVEAVPNRKKLNLALNIISNGDVKFFEKENHTYSSLYFQAHNEYLEFWFEAGLVGFLLLVYAVVVRMVNGWKRDIPFYGVMASAITSLFFFTWHITPMALITVLYVGMMIGEE